jgi:hypothetical protein
VEVLSNTIQKNLEHAVTSSISKISKDKPSLTSEGLPFRSRRLIPREARTLLRRQLQLSNKIRACTRAQIIRCTALKQKLSETELALEVLYKNKIKKKSTIFGEKLRQIKTLSIAMLILREKPGKK